MLRPMMVSALSPVMSGVMQARRRGGVVALPAFDYLVTVGSSTTYQSLTLHPEYGRQENAVRKVFTDAGVDVPVINKAVSNTYVADLDASIASYISSIAGSTKKFAFLINIGSNNIQQTSFAGTDQPTKDAMIAGLNSIADKIIAAGHTPIIATVHSRDGYAASYEEWAEGMYRPLCLSRTPAYFAAPLAKFDYCRLYFLNKDVVDWWQVDGVHPKLATTPYQQYTVDQLKLSASLPAISPKEKFVFSLRGSAPVTNGGINAKSVTASAGSITEVYNSNGVLVAGASFSWGASGGLSSGARGNPGIFDVDVTHDDVLRGAIFRSGGSVPFTFSRGVSHAGRTGTMTISASATGSPRITKYTFADATTAVLDLSAGVPTTSKAFTMDGSGNYTFSMAPESPSIYCHLSGVKFVFD